MIRTIWHGIASWNARERNGRQEVSVGGIRRRSRDQPLGLGKSFKQHLPKDCWSRKSTALP